MLTLLEAARETGRTKPAVLKAIKRGRISAAKNDAGEWQIDPAELFRVYPPANPRQEPQQTKGNQVSGNDMLIELAVLRERLTHIEAERERERGQLVATISDLRADRDHWRQQATALLTDQRDRAGELAGQARGRGYLSALWRALRGRGG